MDRRLEALVFACIAACGIGCSGPEEVAGEQTGARGLAIAGDAFGINVAGDGMPGGAAVHALGARWVRIELRDSSSGPWLSEGAQQNIGAQLADYHAHGIQVLLVLDYTTRGGFHAGGTSFCPPEGDWQSWRDDFVSRAGHAAQIWGDSVDAWQIWNEPDHPCGAAAGYDPFVDPHQFGWLARDAYAAIKASSSSPVVLGGLESGDPGYMDEMLAATGGSLHDYGDGIAIQIYGVVPNDDWCVPGGPAEGEYLNCDWGRHDGKVHQYFERSGGLPVWVTEVGLRSADVAKSADYLQDAYEAFASTGDRLARVFWFSYSDAMVAPFGLTDASWQPKPIVYERYQQLAGADAGDDGSTSGGGDAGGDQPAPSCGELADSMGWSNALCEWNGNGACGGAGIPTWDCDVCCEG